MSEFTGTARFTIRRRLGSGGMGVVYLAHDRERGVDVALKTLARVDARGIAGLKNEFRALADVTHPNLVVLHELFCEEGRWFFTMEVVEGASFLEHVLARAARAQHGSSTQLATATDADATVARVAEVVATVVSPPRATDGPGEAALPAEPAGGLACDVSAAPPALRQLAEAVAALHAAGKLHRDIKPSNVLVTREGRVVILDFGLAVIHGERRAEPSSGSRVIEGTPAYMAPEQTVGEPARPRQRLVRGGRDALRGAHRPPPLRRRHPPHARAEARRRAHPPGPRRGRARARRSRPPLRRSAAHRAGRAAGRRRGAPPGRRRRRARRPPDRLVPGRGALRGARRAARRAAPGLRLHAHGARGGGPRPRPIGHGQERAGRALPRRGSGAARAPSCSRAAATSARACPTRRGTASSTRWSGTSAGCPTTRPPASSPPTCATSPASSRCCARSRSSTRRPRSSTRTATASRRGGAPSTPSKSCSSAWPRAGRWCCTSTICSGATSTAPS